MPVYKFKYFDARGFGEVPRLLFALKGQAYEDVRFNKDTWPEERPKTRFQQMPILEVDGKPYNQSSAIARYLARKFGYFGKTEEEGLEIDQVLGIMQDVINVMIKMYYEKDEERKKKFAEEAKEEQLPKYMKMLETILTDNGDFFVGSGITLADIYVFDFADKIKDMVDFDKYPKVKANIAKVGAIPNIKKWVDTRPKTEN